MVAIPTSHHLTPIGHHRVGRRGGFRVQGFGFRVQDSELRGCDHTIHIGVTLKYISHIHRILCAGSRLFCACLSWQMMMTRCISVSHYIHTYIHTYTHTHTYIYIAVYLTSVGLYRVGGGLFGHLLAIGGAGDICPRAQKNESRDQLSQTLDTRPSTRPRRQ